MGGRIDRALKPGEEAKMQIIIRTQEYVDAHGAEPSGEGEWTFHVEYLTRGWREVHQEATFTDDYKMAKYHVLDKVHLTHPSNARSCYITVKP
jgi:hypothetical protein